MSIEHLDRFDFMACLEKIKQGYSDTKYVDVDDICIFLRKIKKTLFHLIDSLNEAQDTVGLSSVLEDVFDIILLIHERTKDKVDLLEEFNAIHDILERYEIYLGIKMKLQILREVHEQCSVYYSRSTDELEKAREKRQENRITSDDYEFLKG